MMLRYSIDGSINVAIKQDKTFGLSLVGYSFKSSFYQLVYSSILITYPILITEHLQHIENNTLKDVSALRNNNDIRRVRPRKESQRDQKIERNAADLDNGRISLLHFLEKSANLFEPSNVSLFFLKLKQDKYVIFYL